MDQPPTDFLLNLATRTLHTSAPVERCNTDAARRAGNLQRISTADRLDDMKPCGWCMVRGNQTQEPQSAT